MIMSHAPANMITNDEYRCIVDPTISFKSSDFGHHACIEPNCGDLFPRLMYRLSEYNERKNHTFIGDYYENEDYIEDNEELMQLLKLQTEEIVKSTLVLKDKRHGKLNKTEEDLFWGKKL